MANETKRGLQSPGQEGGESSASPPQKEKKKGGRELDLSVLDEDSIIIMLQLMVRLDEAGVTVDDFFRDICFDQEVKSSSKRQIKTLISLRY